MSRENVELLQRMYAAVAATGPLAVIDFLSADVEWEQFDVERNVNRGRAAVEVARRRWWSEWEEYRIEAEDFIDAGDQVIVITREYGRAKRSGAKVEDRFFNVFTVDDGEVARFREYRDEREAFEAAGLKE